MRNSTSPPSGQAAKAPATSRDARARAENIVAMADPDSVRAAKTFQAYPNVPKYTDFRRMFDKETKNIDAVLVSCPDHMHATAAMWAMERGKHVYCQKPHDSHRVGSAAIDDGGGQVQGRHPDGQSGLLAAGRAGVLRNHLERRDRQRDGSPRLDQPARSVLAAGSRSGARGEAGTVHLGLGSLAGRYPTATLQPRIRAAQLARLSRITAAAPLATWLAIYSALPTWRCGSARRERGVHQDRRQGQIHFPLSHGHPL